MSHKPTHTVELTQWQLNFIIWSMELDGLSSLKACANSAKNAADYAAACEKIEDVTHLISKLETLK